MQANRLDSRAWLMWGAAGMVPLLVARNPFVIAVVLVSVLAVRAVWASRARQGWGWIVRFAALFMLIGVLFNALTVHSGDRVIARVPGSWPLVGGPITLNAVLYGIVSGLAILTLVLIGTTVASGLVWADLMRSLPPRVAPLAVAGSVAWSFLPGASRAFIDIRESQAARGHRMRGLRDLPPLVVPLLGGGLEGAIAISEALEARGFGNAGDTPTQGRPVGRWLLVGALGGSMLLAYAFAVGQVRVAVAGLILTVLFGSGAFATDRGTRRRTTRYRVARWAASDRAVALAGALALAIFIWRQAASPAAATFNPYPSLTWPVVDVLMLAGLAVLVVPAFVVPVPGEDP